MSVLLQNDSFKTFLCLHIDYQQSALCICTKNYTGTLIKFFAITGRLVRQPFLTVNPKEWCSQRFFSFETYILLWHQISTHVFSSFKNRQIELWPFFVPLGLIVKPSQIVSKITFQKYTLLSGYSILCFATGWQKIRAHKSYSQQLLALPFFWLWSLHPVQYNSRNELLFGHRIV